MKRVACSYIFSMRRQDNVQFLLLFLGFREKIVLRCTVYRNWNLTKGFSSRSAFRIWWKWGNGKRVLCMYINVLIFFSLAVCVPRSPWTQMCACLRCEACWIFEFSLIYYILQSAAKEKNHLPWYRFGWVLFKLFPLLSSMIYSKLNSFSLLFSSTFHEPTFKQEFKFQLNGLSRYH